MRLLLLSMALWGLLGHAAARGGVSEPRGGLWLSVALRRRGIAAPSERKRTLKTATHAQLITS